MAEEPANSTMSATTEQKPNSVNATIDSSLDFGGTESSGNYNAESSVVAPKEDEREKSLEHAEELMVRGSKAARERDYVEAIDCYSRALEIKVAHYGELAPECVTAYYKYGCALLYKAQEEADPFACMPNKTASGDASEKDGSMKSAVNVESSAASVSNNVGLGENVNGSREKEDQVTEGNGDEDEGESDDEDLNDGDEDESDLDLAWKMLDVARAIAEKQPGDTLEKVDILSSLAEVALEREDVETSLSDYLKALSILQHLVESDSRLIAELNFRICLCLEIGSKPEEAIPYCQNAISTCKSRVHRLTGEVKKLSETATEGDNALPQSSNTSRSDDPVAEKEAEIETLNGLCSDLEKKLEDLHQLVANPTSLVKDILGIMSAKAKAISSSQLGAAAAAATHGESSESPTVSTAHTSGSSGVTHLGVVGRGVKRVATGSVPDSSSAKKPAIAPPSNNGECGSSS